MGKAASPNQHDCATESCFLQVVIDVVIDVVIAGELTGDSRMTKQQISEASTIVTTPEKRDAIARKQTDANYTNCSD